MAEDRATPYRSSSLCDSGQCVEVGKFDESVHLRHSAAPDIELIFSREVYASWLDAIKRGEFDRTR